MGSTRPFQEVSTEADATFQLQIMQYIDMRQLLESWYDKSTFAIATWRGDAQRYWLTQVLDCARNKHDQWLQSTPAQRASLEPAYILGDRKHIPEAQNAVESVLRTELLDVIPKSIADAYMRHGHCTVELIVWYVMKQLILPHDINEVHHAEGDIDSTQGRSFDLDQGCAWLEEMQHRLNICMKTGQQVHPRTVITFVKSPEWHYPILSNSWQYLGQSISQASIEGIQSHSWESLFHACRVPSLSELRLHEEQEQDCSG